MGSVWSSTHTVLATANASDVLKALKSHLRYRRLNFKQRALNRSPDPELEEQRRLDINRYNRQHNVTIWDNLRLGNVLIALSRDMILVSSA
jgi:hypothetical protein